EIRKLRERQARLDGLLPARLSDLRRRVAGLQAAVESGSPLARLRHDRERLIGLQAGLSAGLQHALALRRERVQSLERQLGLMNPYATLERGYSITYNAAGHVVSSVAGIAPGDNLAVQMADGTVGVQATSGRTVPAHV
ncbi:MAG TPA: exodeoxyribonuclease VII large subunit, partial [Chloroflexota bacterium]|nr:exodeoxyribonuclease VII large subunit [Chloroflexota bacterium]